MSAASPTRSSMPATRPSISSAVDSSAKMRSGSAMLSPMVMRGFKLASGSWNTICRSRRGPLAQDGAGQGRLARSGFADEPQGLSREEVETHIAQRRAGAESDPQIRDPQQGFVRGGDAHAERGK